MTKHTHGLSVTTARADEMSASEFLDALGIPKTDSDLLRRQCIAAIKRGDTYGWPPMMVDECRKLMADAERYTELKKTGTGGYWL